MPDQAGEQDIWGTRFNELVKGYSYQEFKLKNIIKQETSSSWTNKYYTETSAELTGGPQDAIKGVPKLANFPEVLPSWTLVTATMKKYAAQTHISWEEVKTNQFDTMSRLLLKTARAVANAVDLDIYAGLSGASGINTTASSAAWAVGGASGNPVQDITVGIRKIVEAGYDAHDGGYLLLSPLDYSTLLQYLHAKGAQGMVHSDGVLSNGKVGSFLGLTVIVSTSVTADECMVIIGNKAATWVSAGGLQSATEINKGVDYTVKCWEMGVLEVHDVKAIHTTTNTQT